ncbi:hypothetical protein LY76DRAFT_403836 [Colletotrichum caudatum]|nr:hypothetical protein LY76DRAFT_403836 [Colletotrichum caudatum]
MRDRGLWHVFKIVSHKEEPDGSIYLQVAWVGSPDTTWEPAANIQEAACNLVDSYCCSISSHSGQRSFKGTSGGIRREQRMRRRPGYGRMEGVHIARSSAVGKLCDLA